ncbi:MAG: hypothetical protein IH840_03720 [Candidatus Heimdallarchaeota archaeon]|nr:hypothetical protein [Candidatus Heimdallarchaeota archaeon]
MTGVSIGIGKRIVEILASKGHPIDAGGRQQKDLDKLNEIDNVTPVLL